ncbi:hypothetical protein GOODEAATRI_015632, partial [Goodea atripinnis]
YLFEPEGNACSLTDSTAEEHVLALVEHSADEARDRINRYMPNSKMNCFNQRFRRTAPAHGSSKSELVPSKTPRINGWSWPLQPLQVVGWLVLVYLTVVTFGIFIPLLPRPWNAVSYAVSFMLSLQLWVSII